MQAHQGAGPSGCRDGHPEGGWQRAHAHRHRWGWWVAGKWWCGGVVVRTGLRRVRSCCGSRAPMAACPACHSQQPQTPQTHHRLPACPSTLPFLPASARSWAPAGAGAAAGAALGRAPPHLPPRSTLSHGIQVCVCGGAPQPHPHLPLCRPAPNGRATLLHCCEHPAAAAAAACPGMRSRQLSHCQCPLATPALLQQNHTSMLCSCLPACPPFLPAPPACLSPCLPVARLSLPRARWSG